MEGLSALLLLIILGLVSFILVLIKDTSENKKELTRLKDIEKKWLRWTDRDRLGRFKK
jgi:hypothetical protein